MDKTKKFALIKALDDIRWSTKDGYERFYFETDYYSFEVDNELFENENINKIKENINPQIAEKILLSHYLIYITNRQMDYRHIFKAGAYVLSKIAEEFLKSKRDYSLEKAWHFEKKEKKLYFKASKPKEEKIINYFKDKELFIEEGGNEVKFASRFISVDFLCVYKTLKTLQEKGLSFADFLKNNCDNFNNMAKAMYELTYNIPKISIKDEIWDFKKFTEQKISSEKKFDKFHSKRIWCVIRDYFYHPIFKACLKTVLDDKKFKHLEDNFADLELPGDVWNNNKKFAKCFWGKIETKSFNSSKFVRDKYKKDKENWGKCLPVHFDITFNIVPQLCMNDECNGLCPLEKRSNFEQICHKKNDKYCSFVLYATGIKHKCTGAENCEILKILKN